MIKMAEIETQLIVDDLEDGEIESDGEQAEEPVPEPIKEAAALPAAPISQNTELTHKNVKSKTDKNKSPNKDKKSKKKSKEKSHHHNKNDRDRGEHKSHRDKSRKYQMPLPVEDDFAGNIEKAIRKAMKGSQGEVENRNEIEINDSGIDDAESKKKNKKRKKHGQPDKEGSKKRKRQKETEDEVDEDEMMCVRGASPIMKYAPSPQYAEDEDESDSESSQGSTEKGKSGRGRKSERGRRADRNHTRNRRQDVHPNQDPDGVCLFFMLGKCYKGDECTFSHDAQPPRKMELCKFYLMDCCAKKEKCLYLHSDFPCKYYHTGLPCIHKDECKFAHGKPLSDSLKAILLKHIELAPKEILGDFPRLSRDAAALMVASTQNKLMQQYGMKPKEKDKSAIPSIFDLNIPKPANFDENKLNNTNKEKARSQKVRQSRWGDNSSAMPFSSANPDDILSIQNLNGVLNPNQISQLIQLGIENLNQLSQLTVIQLNQLGLTLAQINEIQLNTMSIQKLGLINAQSSASPSMFAKLNQDLDLRVSPIIPDLSSLGKNDPMSKDVDMRFQTNSLPEKIIDVKHDTDSREFVEPPASSPNVENVNEPGSNSDIDNRTTNMDYDHRVLQCISDATVANVKLNKDENIDQDIKTQNDLEELKSVNTVMKHQQHFISQKKDKIENLRRMTTDDEDDNTLHIDEKWYSSDEEKGEKSETKQALQEVEQKIKSPPQNESPSKSKYTPTPAKSNETQATTVITQLGDLSKIDISAEVTKLLTTIKNNTPAEEKEVVKKEDPRSRDPRNIPKKSPEHKSSSSHSSSLKKPSSSSSSKPVISIYNCLEENSEDKRKKSDVDLRLMNDVDFRLSKFGDTDLRQTSSGGDVDFRLGLPFKSLPNYTPASEIDGSITSHPPIPFKLVQVHVPRPDYTEIRNSTPKTQAAQDPRLRKIFRLSLDENPSSENVDKKKEDVKSARIDPRKKSQENKEDKEKQTKPPALDLQVVIQTSDWYKDLSSNQKILVNQQLACVTASLKKFQQDPNPNKIFDLNEIHSNNVLTKIFANLGIILNEKGEFAQVQLPDNTQMPQMNYDAYNNMNMGSMMDSNMMNMGNFGYQGNGQPGLLGMAPSMPHGYDANFPNGMLNFNDNNFNSNFDNQNNLYNNGGNMNDFGDNYDDTNFYNRNNQNSEFNKPYSRGRGNERWRGSRGRDRRGFTERGGSGNWKGDNRRNNNN